jgi:hypothetical protein
LNIFGRNLGLEKCIKFIKENLEPSGKIDERR